jgi:hypothetical protein
MNRSPTTFAILSSLLLGIVAIGGCSSTTLETGYKPRLLGAGDAERKAFYSAKYTRAAALAEQEKGKDAEFRARRPDYRPGM